jgi:hypothetical protein
MAGLPGVTGSSGSIRTQSCDFGVWFPGGL